MIQRFISWLRERERSERTTERYAAEVGNFITFTKGEISKESVIRYKEHLKESYKPASINSKVAAVNAYLSFIGKGELRIRFVKVQRNIFSAREKFLSKEEYTRLLRAAEGNERLYLAIQAITASGLRVSELRFITYEALERGTASISLKGKTRVIFIPKKLCRTLLKYAKRRGIGTGAIFITKGGKVIDRSNLWKEMKRLCESARVDKSKVFPHNLRHLFAREFYKAEKDIVRLADILGHSSIETTRIYTMETAEEQRKKIERLGLLLI